MSSFTIERPPALTARSSGPPAWFILATIVLTVVCLVMAVAETTLWMHYLIDGGEAISLLGLGFVAAAGTYLYSKGRLLGSLPLVFPWLLFPLITQGDQIIDHLPINAMRVITHVLLAAIFATPVAVTVLAARQALAGGRVSPGAPALKFFPGLRLLAAGRIREGSAFLAVALLVLEMWVAVQYLGTLMIVTLVVMSLGVLWYGSGAGGPAPVSARWTERSALVLLVGGLALSLGLYFAFKNRPGAYQGSPSYYLDPSQAGAGFDLGRIPVPSSPPIAPSRPALVEHAFTAYGRTLEHLLSGYYILDRNYTWDFHNELFIRRTPLLANYRMVALQRIGEAAQMRADADRSADAAETTLAEATPLAAALDDLRAFVAFNFDRAAVMEQMSAGFERTKAGLQHAAHLYEGEGKIVAEQFAALLTKHRAAIEHPAHAEITRELAAIGRSIRASYANRVVGF